MKQLNIVDFRGCANSAKFHSVPNKATCPGITALPTKGNTGTSSSDTVSSHTQQRAKMISIRRTRTNCPDAWLLSPLSPRFRLGQCCHSLDRCSRPSRPTNNHFHLGSKVRTLVFLLSAPCCTLFDFASSCAASCVLLTFFP